jgi:hypothetical protein
MGCIFETISVNAQCLPGWNSTTLTFGPDPNGCSWIIEFCYKCGISGADPANVKVMDIKPANPRSPCPNWTPDETWLRSQFMPHYALFCDIPPCSTGCRILTLEFPICYQWSTFGWQNPDLSYHYKNWKTPCINGDYCIVTWQVCRDEQTLDIIKCPNSPDPNYQRIEYTCNRNSPWPSEPGEPSVHFTGWLQNSECYKEMDCP